MTVGETPYECQGVNTFGARRADRRCANVHDRSVAINRASHQAARANRSDRAWHSMQRLANGKALSRFGAIGFSQSMQTP